MCDVVEPLLVAFYNPAVAYRVGYSIPPHPRDGCTLIIIIITIIIIIILFPNN